MITPKLEELILCGKAQYRTFGCRFSSNYKIRIPDNSVIVVTDIIWNHFLQTPGETDPTLKTWSQNNAFQLRFSDTDKRFNHIHIQNSMKVVLPANFLIDPLATKMSDLQDKGLLLPEVPQQFHVYFIHKKLLQINLINHEFAKGFTYTYGQIVDLPGELLAPPIDTGGLPFGASLNTIVEAKNVISAGDTCEVFPQGRDFTPLPLPSSVANNEFIQLNDQRYQLQDPSTLPYINSATPLFTIGYVLITDTEIVSTLSNKA